MIIPRQNKVVYILMGIPGSGKSTWIENNLLGLPVVSKDNIRIELGIIGTDKKGVGNQNQEKLVSKIHDNRIKSLIRKHKSFVLDNTNINIDRLKDLLSLFRENGYYTFGVLIDTPLHLCLQRRPEIPSNILVSMHSKITKIDPSWFSKFVKISNRP